MKTGQYTKAVNLISDILPINLELPVSLLADGNVGEVSAIVLGIAASQDQFTSFVSFKIMCAHL